MATSRKTDTLCPNCTSEDTGNTLHRNTYEFECGTHWIPAEYHAGGRESLRITVACRTIKAYRDALHALRYGRYPGEDKPLLPHEIDELVKHALTSRHGADDEAR